MGACCTDGSSEPEIIGTISKNGAKKQGRYLMSDEIPYEFY